MNQTVANILKDYIEDCGCSFVDKIAGLVQTVHQDILDKDGNKVQKAYPVSCNFTAEDCKTGLYNDLTPDSKYKTVIYFEDGGLTFNNRQGKFTCYTSNLKLVCWINTALYKADWCGQGIPCTVSTEIIKKILCCLPQLPVTITPFVKFLPVIVSEDIRSNSIFSKYTFNELQTQYLLYPYDYFALNIKTDFCICMDCDDECT
jgi:hypothetical protein